MSSRLENARDIAILLVVAGYAVAAFTLTVTEAKNAALTKCTCERCEQAVTDE